MLLGGRVWRRRWGYLGRGRRGRQRRYQQRWQQRSKRRRRWRARSRGDGLLRLPCSGRRNGRLRRRGGCAVSVGAGVGTGSAAAASPAAASAKMSHDWTALQFPCPALLMQSMSPQAVLTCAALADGRVQCWGLNDVGQLGNGSDVSTNSPVEVDIQNVVSVTAGSNYTCAIQTNGSAWCWGFNSSGQLGDGSLNGSNVPVPVMP